MIFKEANDHLTRLAVSPEQHALLTRFLMGTEEKTREQYLPFVDLPLVVHSAITGDENPPANVSIASLFLYLAADILDDIADGDFENHWGKDISSSEGILASWVFASSIAPLALEDLDIQTQRICLIKQTLSKCILRMAAGQQGDLQSSESLCSTSPRQVIKNVQGKSGAEIEGFCLMAAQLAGVDEYLASEYGSIGNLLGTGGQIMTDCYELYAVSEGRDLNNGTVTLPLAIHFQSLSEDEKGNFLNLLMLAQHDESSRPKVRDLVAQSGALEQTYSFIKKCKIEALDRLERLKPLEPAATELRSAIKRSCSFSI